MAFGAESHRTRERRLALRVLTLWRELCGDKPFARRSAFDLGFLGNDARFCFLIDLDAPAPTFAWIGEWLAMSHGGSLGRPVAETAADTLLAAAASPLGRLLEWRTPVSHGGETRLAGQRFLYRGILLPLSEDGERIDAVLGAANGRLVSTEGLSAEG